MTRTRNLSVKWLMNIKTIMGHLNKIKMGGGAPYAWPRRSRPHVKKTIKMSTELWCLQRETKAFTLKLEMDELFSASFNVSFTQLTIMSSLTFCPPPISSRMFSVYLSKIKNDFWRKVAKEFHVTKSSQG